LTNGMTAAFQGDATAIKRLSHLLDRREFSVVASAPRDLPHAMMMRQLRERATVDDWLPIVLGGIAEVLAHNGALTEAEADWLATAGGCWCEPGAGPKREMRPRD
jgi:hypothetical protein